jgi:hypothetical protein
MNITSDKITCDRCLGSGIDGTWRHGDTEDSIEPLRCEKCEGVGRVNAILFYPPMEPINAWLDEIDNLVIVSEKRPFDSPRYRPVSIVDRPQPSMTEQTNESP